MYFSSACNMNGTIHIKILHRPFNLILLILPISKGILHLEENIFCKVQLYSKMFEICFITIQPHCLFFTGELNPTRNSRILIKDQIKRW